MRKRLWLSGEEVDRAIGDKDEWRVIGEEIFTNGEKEKPEVIERKEEVYRRMEKEAMTMDRTEGEQERSE